MFFRNPGVEVGVALLLSAYLGAALITGNRFRRYQAWALALAIAVMLFVLDGPMDALEDAGSFSAHMLQHLALALVFPPLLLLATPDWMIRPLIRVPAVRRAVSVAAHPLVAFMVYNMVLVGLHSPRIFDLMCRNDDFHIAMHLLLIAVAMPLWMPLLSPAPELPRLSYPAQMLYLFFWLIPMAAIAAPISISNRVIYSWYANRVHPLGLTPVADQIIGGLIMWVGAGFYMIGVFTTIYFQWARRDDLDEPEINFAPIPVASPFRSRSH
jgi:putative membrane protein